jgi:hypothetical protein
MQNTFEEIRRQIHEIRNFLAPFDLKLAILDERIAKSRVLFEQRVGRVESGLEEQGLKILDLLERVNLVEMLLKIPPKQLMVRKSATPSPGPGPSPAREDKQSPEILPPQKPGA